MKAKRNLIIGISGLSLCALAATALGQADQPGYGTRPTTSTSEERAGSQKEGQSKHFFRSKDLVGANIKNPQGQDLGEISEIVINPKNGQTLAAIDVGDRNALVPVQALTVAPGRGVLRSLEVTLNKTKSALESGPTVSDNEWSQLDNPAFTQRIFSYYNVRAPAAGMGGAGDDAMGGSEAGGGNRQTRPNQGQQQQQQQQNQPQQNQPRY